MTTLEKLAERVREQGGVATLSCEVCAYKPRNSERCTQHSCPQEQAPDGALMLARWEAHLVMNNKLWELHKVVGYRHSNSGLKKADRDYRDACAALGWALIALITEASEKQVKEGSDGSQG